MDRSHTTDWIDVNFVFVALGGALGAMLRYAISLMPYKGSFPVLTLVTNILGAIAIGFIVGLASTRKNLSPQAVLFLKTGFCGGFTTFSTFSLETYDLLDQGRYANGGLYMVLSLVFCLLGVWVGERLATALG